MAPSSGRQRPGVHRSESPDPTADNRRALLGSRLAVLQADEAQRDYGAAQSFGQSSFIIIVVVIIIIVTTIIIDSSSFSSVSS